MAQAARLNLRMQKELKLLMADPPPGVSFPSLSDNPNQSSLSLSSIDARIEGPEETVYSKGIFTVKIQIPERYPFQPPNVTFTTPIYHPNIDNGGRICLDILNLPPKGAWQPSMNISTVLTSIRLLLSEPNPDDALMAEISREYKYNAHAFEQKAKEWTERYANPGFTTSVDRVILTSLNVAPVEADRAGTSENPVKENDRTRKKLRLTCENLSAKPLVPTGINNDGKENKIPAQEICLRLTTEEIVDKQMNPSCSKLLQNSTAEFDQNSFGEHVQNVSTDTPKQAETSSEFLETIIVSDSEESDDEYSRPSRSILSLLRNRI